MYSECPVGVRHPLNEIPYKLVNQSMASFGRSFLCSSAVRGPSGSGARLPAFPAPPHGANHLTSLYLFSSPRGRRASTHTYIIKLNELIHVKHQEQCLAHSNVTRSKFIRGFTAKTITETSMQQGKGLFQAAKQGSRRASLKSTS